VDAPIYLDYAATTPVDASVARTMIEALSAEAAFGNASSATHVFGRRAEALVETARAQVAALVGAQSGQIVFTSGATESNNLALLGVARASVGAGTGGARTRHVVTSKIEHKAVLDVCKQLEREGFAVTYVAPDSSGRVQPEAVKAALRADTVLVSVMHANNETGVIQDIATIGRLCREKGIPFHVDAAQSVGKLPIDVAELPVDLLSFTAHKIYGPKGIGALYVAPSVRAGLRPVSFGGGQEGGLRPGTLPTHQIVGFGMACELASRTLATEPARLLALRDRLWTRLARLEGVHLNGEAAPRLPGILNVSVEGVEGESLVTSLGALAVSTGSACSSASGDPSYVLRALGRSTQLAQSSLRFSLGRPTTEADIDRAADVVQLQVERLREVSPAPGKDLSPGLSADAPAALLAARRLRASSSQAIESTAPNSPLLLALSPATRDLFLSLPHAGSMPPGADVIHGEAGGPGTDTWVRFSLQIDRRADESFVKAALFKAYGCPHTLSVSAWLTGQLPGRSMTDLVPGTPSAWLQAFEVPVEKLGRLLTVEDALRATFQQSSPAL
jgi:cysteine desulfurase